MTRGVPLPAIETRETFWRTLLTFNVTRVVIALLLLIYLIFNIKKDVVALDQRIYWQICIGYLFLALGFAVVAINYRRRFLLQLLSQITVDLVVISMLYAAAGGTKSGLAILYLFPLAGGAILAPTVLALFFVSVATLFLLAESAYQLLAQAAESTFSQAGLYGAAYFAAVFVINRLAARLIKQEKLAVRRGIDLQVQEAINRLIIADMGDGVLVVGREGEILTGNPAAERMLGLTIPYVKPHSKLDEIPSLMPIADAYSEWITRLVGNMPGKTDGTTFVVVKPGEDTTTLGPTTIWGKRRDLGAHLKLRFARVDTAGLAEDKTVIFLQDVTEIENQAQQLKLASMGRLTASIAHEVRNPLSAISYASSLLSEEPMNQAQTRLLNIVGDNVARLNRMIEDILKLSRKAQTRGEPLALAPFFAEILGEFRETRALPADIIDLGDMHQYYVWFDPLHLREVVVNLLTNALRYASGRRASIRIYALSDVVNRLELHVQDDGPPITPAVRAHLFEPFYTTSNKGTGLGLYLARELCLNNDAMIDYEYRMDFSDGRVGKTSGRFVITCAMAGAV